MIGLFGRAAEEFLARFPHVPESSIQSAGRMCQRLFEVNMPGQHVIDDQRLTRDEWQLVFKLTGFLLDAELPRSERYGCFIVEGSDAEGQLCWLRPHGRIQVIRVHERRDQAAAAVSELRRLSSMGVHDWSSIAILGQAHADLARVRALAEREGIPIRWWADRDQVPPLHQVREIHNYLEWLRAQAGASMSAADLIAASAPLLKDRETNPWTAFLAAALDAWKIESLNSELPVYEALEFLWSYVTEARRNISYGSGVTLSTIHAAKGSEHDHVLLVGSWSFGSDREKEEELRRLLYVGMTRSRHTLCILDTDDERGSLTDILQGPEVLRQTATSKPRSECAPDVDYHMFGLEQFFIGFAGVFPEDQPAHAALAALKPGDHLQQFEKPASLPSSGEAPNRIKIWSAAKFTRRLTGKFPSWR